MQYLRLTLSSFQHTSIIAPPASHYSTPNSHTQPNSPITCFATFLSNVLPFNMASTSNSKTLGKRVCRKRKPPLTPRPPLQFVVASHPDEFKARETMRNVRSHVMYKHNEQRGFSPSDRTISQEGSRALSTTRTPSPMTTNSDGILDTPFVVPMPTRNHGTSWDEDLYDLETQLSTANPFRALTTRLICITTAAPARSAPPTSGKASEYPFPGDSLLVYESLRTLKQEYVSSTDFFCHGMWRPAMMVHLSN